MKEQTPKRMHEVLTGKDTSKALAHLTDADRKAILEIPRDTLPDPPDHWKK